MSAWLSVYKAPSLPPFPPSLFPSRSNAGLGVKLERVTQGSESGGEVSLLGCWVGSGWKVDMPQAGVSWGKCFHPELLLEATGGERRHELCGHGPALGAATGI